MSRATLVAVLASFLAIFGVANLDIEPWLLWQVMVGDTTGAMAEATIVTGTQPWATTLSEYQAAGDGLSIYRLGVHGVDVHWNGLDCRLIDMNISVEWNTSGASGLGFLINAVTVWQWTVGCVVVLSGLMFLTDVISRMRRDVSGSLAAIGLVLVSCMVLVTALALLGPAISMDPAGFIFEEPGCSGGLILQAQFVGVRAAGVAWLVASVVFGCGAVAAIGWRIWPVIRAGIRGPGIRPD